MEAETAAAVHTGATTITTEDQKNLVLETRAVRAPETTLHGYRLQLETLLGRRWNEGNLIRTRLGLVEVSDHGLSLEDVVESEFLYLRGETQEPERLAATFLGYYRLFFTAMPVANEVHSERAPETEAETETEDWLEMYFLMEEHALRTDMAADIEIDIAWENVVEMDDESEESDGSSGTPYDGIVVERLKKLKTREFNGEEERHEDEQTCSVCLEDLYRGTVAALDCRHEFHLDCLRRWLIRGMNACPLCRARAIRH